MSQIIVGRNPITEALNNNIEFESIFVQDGATGEFFQWLRMAAAKQNIKIKSIPPDAFKKFGNAAHQGVAGIVSAIDYHNTLELAANLLEKEAKAILFMLDGVTDVRNLGGIARTAWSAGVSGIIVPNSKSAAINSDAVKASAGALLQMPVCRESNLPSTLRDLKNMGYTIYGTATNMTNKPIVTAQNAVFKYPCVFVLGNEAEGISIPVQKNIDTCIALPQVREFDSYNVAAATAMICYQIMLHKD